MRRAVGLLLAAAVVVTNCASEAPDDARLAGDGPAELPDSEQEQPEGSWRIPFAEDDGTIRTTVPPSGIGTVEIETDGPVELTLAVTTEDIDHGSTHRVDLSWEHSDTVASPAVEEREQDCQDVPGLDADEWTSGPLLFAGLDAPAADQYRLRIQHNCDRAVTFQVAAVEATREPQGIVGDWSSGWLPDDAGWREGWAPSFLSVDDDGTMSYCVAYSEGSADTIGLQWEPRGDGRVGMRRPGGETTEPRVWLVGDRLVLIDSTVGSMFDWLGGLSSASTPDSTVGWTAGWGDIFVRRSDSERPAGC